MGCGNNVRNALSSMPVGLPPFESGYAVMTAKIVISGGGLAGLSAGYHLADFEPASFEKEKAIGGLCGSFTQDGFSSDGTAHLVHTQNAYTTQRTARLLPYACP